jgi:hypothetical protein
MTPSLRCVYDLIPALPPVRRVDLGGQQRVEAVSKLGEILRPAAPSADFHDFFVSGRSQGSKKRTK